MKIDVFPHIIPPKYLAALEKKAPSGFQGQDLINAPISKVDVRLQVTNCYPDYVEVLNIGSPPLELVLSPKDAIEVARIANDELAELLVKHPDKFVGAVACLPMNDMDAALKEAERAIITLRFRGIQIYTEVNGYPLDHQMFMPLYEMMCKYNLPILVHPWGDMNKPNYSTETKSKYRLPVTFGWPHDTSIFMARLVYSGILEKYPNLKIVTHHCGGMIPFFGERIRRNYNMGEDLSRDYYPVILTKHPMEYFHLFYADTALLGSTSGLMCGYDFFGADHLLFGTDFPFGVQLGHMKIRETIRSIEEMTISAADKKKIYEDNARWLFRLPV